MRLRVQLTKRRLLAILILASAASAALGQGLAGRLRPAVQVAMMPFGDGGMYLTTAFESHLNGLLASRIPQPEARRLKQDNEALRDQIARLDQRLQRQESLLKIAQNYRGLYGPGGDAELPWELLPARVVMMGPLPYGATRVANRGSANGVRPGLKVTERVALTDRAKALRPGLDVVAGAALVGRVIESSAYSARIQLVSDSAFQIDARILRDVRNVRYIVDASAGQRQPLTAANNEPVDAPNVRGDGAGRLIVPNVKEDHNVLPGDVLVTRAEDYALPVSLRIGVVAEVEKYPNSPGFVLLRVRPATDLAALRAVHIVIPLPPGQAE